MKLVALALSLGILLTYNSVGRALTGGPIEGQVLDYYTGAPISGAFVAARWEGELLSGRTVCVHVETAVSDASGRYHIGQWTQLPTAPVEEPAPVLDVYKAEYEGTPSPLDYVGHDGKWVVFHRERPTIILQTFADRESARLATHPTNVYVKPFIGTRSERLEYVAAAAFSAVTCRSGGASRRNLYPLQKAAFSEARSLATAGDDALLSSMRATAESNWLGLPPDAPYPEKRVLPEQFIRDFQ